MLSNTSFTLIHYKMSLSKSRCCKQTMFYRHSLQKSKMLLWHSTPAGMSYSPSLKIAPKWAHLHVGLSDWVLFNRPDLKTTCWTLQGRGITCWKWYLSFSSVQECVYGHAPAHVCMRIALLKSPYWTPIKIRSFWFPIYVIVNSACVRNAPTGYGEYVLSEIDCCGNKYKWYLLQAEKARVQRNAEDLCRRP